MDNVRLLLKRALAAVSWSAVLPIVFAVACWADAPTPTQPVAPTITGASAAPSNSTAGPPPTETQRTIPTPTLTPTPLRHDAAVPPLTAAAKYPASTPATQPTFRHIPPPIVGLDTGRGTAFVEPELLALLTNHAAAGDQAPDRLRVVLIWDNIDGATTDFIVSQRGVRETDTYDPASPWADYVWRIPVESMLTVLQHLGVWSASLWDDRQTEQRERPDHPKLNETANLVVTAWRLGMPAENAAQYALLARGGCLVGSMKTGNGPDIERLLAWLESEGVYIIETTKTSEKDEHGKVVGGSTAGLVPVSVIATAAEREDVRYISAESYSGNSLEMQRYCWPLETL